MSNSNDDPVNKPAHYNLGEVECIDAIRSCLGPEGFAAYCHGNSMKYLWRHNYKGNPTQDLEKAIWYINKLIEERKTEELTEFIEHNEQYRTIWRRK